MDKVSCFDTAVVEAVCRILGDTSTGLSGEEIGRILLDMRINDPTPHMTKWKRIFNALAEVQNRLHVGNHLLMFINRAMAPARYISDASLFKARQDDLNVALSFVGYGVGGNGKVIRSTRESSLKGARARAKRLKNSLEDRGTHQEVFTYCREELLEENYFHAVFESVKGLAERIRTMSGLKTDGAELVNQAFSVKSPFIAINNLKSETELSEQKGIANLLIGLFGAIRNPTAHAPKILWAMPEQDALDIFALVSYIHRKLDRSSQSKTP